jgi:hypothetical protein
MPSYALKSRRVLQLRKYLADKRENHEFSVYQRRLGREPGLGLSRFGD